MSPMGLAVVEVVVQGIAAIATAAALGVVLLRDRLGRLILELDSPMGRRTTLNPGAIPARYFHLRVRNRRRAFPVHEVRCHYLMCVDHHMPSNTWHGPVPLNWRHQRHEPRTKTLGPDAIADLFATTPRGDLQLMAAYVPNNSVAPFRQPMHLTLVVQAHGNESDSTLLRVDITWPESKDIVVTSSHLRPRALRRMLSKHPPGFFQ